LRSMKCHQAAAITAIFWIGSRGLDRPDGVRMVGSHFVQSHKRDVEVK